MYRWKKGDYNITFFQHPIDAINTYLNTEDANIEIKYIMEYEVYISKYSDIVCVIWQNSSYGFYISMNDISLLDDLEHFISGVTVK